MRKHDSLYRSAQQAFAEGDIATYEQLEFEAWVAEAEYYDRIDDVAILHQPNQTEHKATGEAWLTAK